METEAPAQGRKTFFRRRKSCPLTGDHAPKVDYKDVRLLQRFITERGKIVPCRISAVSAPKQRELAQAIKRARFIALMPYVSIQGHAGGERRSFDRGEGRSEYRGDRTERSA